MYKNLRFKIISLLTIFFCLTTGFLIFSSSASAASKRTKITPKVLCIEKSSIARFTIETKSVKPIKHLKGKLNNIKGGTILGYHTSRFDKSMNRKTVLKVKMIKPKKSKKNKKPKLQVTWTLKGEKAIATLKNRKCLARDLNPINDFTIPIKQRIDNTKPQLPKTTPTTPTNPTPPTVQNFPPVNNTLPKIFGLTITGQTLSADNGSWSGNEPISFNYQWQRCNENGEDCSDINFANSNTYLLTDNDINKTIRTKINATNPYGSNTSTSLVTSKILGINPSNTSPPIINGLANIGQILTVTNGIWAGTTPIVYSYQWQRCDNDGSNCLNIDLATSNNYTLTNADLNKKIRAIVNAVNVNNVAVNAFSNFTNLVNPELIPLNNISLPMITGNLAQDEVLSGSNGVWEGTTPITYNYQWQRCDINGNNCIDISSANTNNYTLTNADVNNTIRFKVTADNILPGNLSAVSSASALIDTGIAPLNTVLPLLTLTDNIGSGNNDIPEEGDFLETNLGIWTGTNPITYQYNWERCDNNGDNCIDLNNDSEIYNLSSNDIGFRIKSKITATNYKGTSDAYSSLTDTINATLFNLALPTISGLYFESETISADSGTWFGVLPITYSYQWYRCIDENDCISITNDSSANVSYRIINEDVGKYLKVKITADNNAPNTVTEYSQLTSIIQATAPINDELPSINGYVIDGSSLQGDIGQWRGSQPISYEYEWYRCLAINNDSCEIISTNLNYNITTQDLNHKLKFKVIATNDIGTREATSLLTNLVIASLPINISLPTITGNNLDASTLLADKGSWIGTSPIDYSYQWERCDENGDNCNNIVDATNENYTLTSNDIGYKIRLKVTASNLLGNVEAFSSQTELIGAIEVNNTSIPNILGYLDENEIIATDNGSWTGSEPIIYSYQWILCDNTGNNCNNINNATNQTYTLTNSDIGNKIKVEVTADNYANNPVTVSSELSNVIQIAAPVNSDLPVLSGNQEVGQSLNVTNGTWAGLGPITYNYQWERCDSAGNNCIVINGENNNSYNLVADDYEHRIKAKVTANNDSYNNPFVYSNLSNLINAEPLSNIVLPTINYTNLEDGETITVNNGTWLGTAPITYSYQWQQCVSPNEENNCYDINNATNNNYTLTSADNFTRIRVQVTGSNIINSQTVYSNLTASWVEPKVPTNIELPALIGTFEDQKTISVWEGTWEGTVPINYNYSWFKCDNLGNNCIDLDYHLSNYDLTNSDIGYKFKVEVRANNMAGNTLETTALSPTISVASPNNQILPSFTGILSDGQILSGNNGVWTGSNPIDYSYQWQRCDSTGNNCENIENAVNLDYTLSADDINKKIRLQVTANNAAPGTVVVYSTISENINAINLTNNLLPIITGLPEETRTLTVDNGSWTGSNPIDYSYQWVRCDNSNNCVDINNATNSTYTLSSADIGYKIKARVIANNPYPGVVNAESLLTDTINYRLLENTVAPSFTGVLVNAQTLTANIGSWTGSNPIDYTYQWQRCDYNSNNCIDINNATNSTYTLTSSDIDNKIRLKVTASNIIGSLEAFSLTSDIIDPTPPNNTALPTISGTLTDGQTLTTSNGSWTGAMPMVYTYQWQRCNSAGAGCVNILNATNNTYTLAGPDADRTIRVVVTANNITNQPSNANSLVTGTINALPLNNTSIPLLEGNEALDAIITTNNGQYSGSPVTNYSYQWYRCDNLGNNCNIINNATNKDYRLVINDVTNTVKVEVTATNSANSVTTFSELSGIIVEGPPFNNNIPYIEGDIQVGKTITGNYGNWTSSLSNINYTYQWQACDENGNNCSNINGATNNTYTITSNELNKSLKFQVTATNSDDNASAISEQTTIVINPPTIIYDQEIINDEPYAYYKLNDTDLTTAIDSSGNNRTLTGQYSARVNGAVPGSKGLDFDGNDDQLLADTWFRGEGDSNFGNYTLELWAKSDDLEKTAYLAGSGTFTSVHATPCWTGSWLEMKGYYVNNTSANYCGVYLNTAKQVINNTNSWYHIVYVRDTNEEKLYVNGVLKDNKARQNSDISGTGIGKFSIASLLGQEIKFDGKIDNLAWYNKALTSQRIVSHYHSKSVIPEAAGNTVLPVISGIYKETEIITATTGTWEGEPEPLDFEYQWQRCNNDGSNCIDITNATNSTYTLASNDVNKKVKVKITANNGNTAIAYSDLSSTITTSPPINITSPSISGYQYLDQVLTGNQGNWRGTAPINYTYQWLRCNSVGASCNSISGETHQTYTVSDADIGYTIRYKITASNIAGSLEVTSNQTALIENLRTYNEEVLADAPYAYYKLDENQTNGVWEDSTNNNRDLTGTVATGDLTGATANSKAVSFNGSGGLTANTWFPGASDSTSTNYTIEFWAKNAAGSPQGLVAGSGGYSGSCWTGGWAAAFNAKVSYFNSSGCVNEFPTPSETHFPDANTWKHVVVRRSLSVLDIFVDGIKVYTNNNSHAPNLSAGRFTIAHLYAHAAFKYVGSVDNVAWYNKILSDDKIIKHYQAKDIIKPYPINTELPVISGNRAAGETLSSTNGTWTGIPTIIYTYQWQRCDNSSGTNCVNINGATNNTYTLTVDDNNKAIKLKVTATNPISSVTVDSNYISGYVYDQLINNSNPIQYWKLDETSGTTALSSTASPLDLIQYPDSVIWNQSGAALGTGTSVNMNTNLLYNINQVAPAFPTTLNSKYTVETWVKWTTSMNIGTYVISSTDRYSLMLYEGKLGFNTLDEIYGINAPQANKWYHIVAVFNNGNLSDGNKLYINGVNKSLSYVFGSSSQSRIFGSDPYFFLGGLRDAATGGNASFRWPGYMDNTSLYNRELTSTEVTEHYSAKDNN